MCSEVSKLVGLARIEPALQRDRVSGELPFRAWNRYPGRSQFFAHAQRVLRRSWVAGCVPGKIGKCPLVVWLVGDEFGSNQTGHANGGGKIDANRALSARIEFPSDLHDGVAAIQQKAVPDLAVGRFRGRTIEMRKRHAAASVHNVKQRDSVSARGIAGLQDHDIGGKLDLAGSVARRLIEVRNHLVTRIGGINDKVDLAGEPFVGAGRSERAAFG